MTEEKKRELLDEGLAHLGKPIDGKLREYAESVLTGYLWRSKLVGRHERRYRCSLRGAEFETDDRDGAPDIYNDFPVTWKLQHGDRLECPDCQRALEVFDEWRFKARRASFVFVEQWRRSAADEGQLVAIGARVRMEYREAWETPEPNIEILSFAVLKYGRRGTRYIKDGLSYRPGYDLGQLDAGFIGCRRLMDTGSVGEAIRGTPFERVWNDEFLYASPEYGRGLYSPLHHISWLGRHPAVEYMLRMGFIRLVREKLVDRYGALKGINFDGRSLEEVMGLDRATVRQLRPYAKDMAHGDMDAFRQLSGMIPEWPVPVRMEYIRALGLRYVVDKLVDAVRERGYRLKDELKYLRKQTDKIGPRIGWAELRDYWRECDRLNVPADDYRTRHPRNLQAAHMEAGKRIKYIESREHDEAIAKIAGAFDGRFAYGACGLFLRCVASSREVIDEGSALNHCVGGYVARYARGDTLIMVLRHTDEPDKPWYTVEMTPDGRVVQCRGYGNQTRYQDKEQIGAFWAAWKDEMRRRKGTEHAKAS